ncbi:hypothetical protein [Azorhizobium sp. AG788]|uniref:hypothetical protein n=1 Tax=Azorhizobium sp. AG788 TaxID=2183897 RepID=UPI003138BE16
MTGVQTGAWRKLGLVFAGPTGGHPALVSHAALPVPYPLDGDLVRIFYSGRDAANRSSVGTLVVRLGDVPRVEAQSADPVLAPGGIGAFDDAGIGIGCIVPGETEDRLYYMGWNVGGAVPWRNAIGVAFGSAREGRFARRFLGPILDRGPVDPYSLSYPWVLRLGPQDWRMWYGTHLEWGATQADMSHAIRAATSTDGLDWRRAPEICLPPQGEEIATVRPSVLAQADGGFEMYFAARGLETPYTIGRAISTDGAAWQRVPAGIHADGESWEGGALTYPAVFEQAGRRWMLFNGRGYGASGFGIAVWEEG